MIEYIKKALYENNELQKNSINGMMRAEYFTCEPEEKSLTLRFPLMDWQKNRAGFLQGGLIGVAFDITVSILARYMTSTNYIPTLSLDIQFHRPVKIQDKLLVKARAISVGKNISTFSLEGIIEGTGKLAASATAIYYKQENLKGSEE